MSQFRYLWLAFLILMTPVVLTEKPAAKASVRTPPSFKAVAAAVVSESAYAVLINASTSQAAVWDAYASHSLYDVTLPVSGDTVTCVAADAYSSGFLLGTAGGRVYTLNPVTGNLTLIGTITNAVIRSMAVRTSDGRIFISNAGNSTVSAMSRSGTVGPTASTSYAPGTLAYDSTTNMVVVGWIVPSTLDGELRVLGANNLDTKGTYSVGNGLQSVSAVDGMVYAAINSKTPKSEVVSISLADVESEENPLGSYSEFVGPISLCTSPGSVHVYDSGRAAILRFNVWGPAADPVEAERITCAGSPTDFADGGSPGGGGLEGGYPAPQSTQPTCAFMAPAIYAGTGVLVNLVADPEHNSTPDGRVSAAHTIQYGTPADGAYPTLETSPITTSTHRYERTNADPVDMSDGSLHEEQDLLSIPDVGLPITVSLQYNSRIKYDGPLGKNWKHTYDDFLTGDSAGHIITVDSYLSHQTYTLETSSGIYKGPFSDSDWITIDSNSQDARYVRMSKFGLRRAYNASGRLTSITDRNGNVQTLLYRCGKLRYVLGSNGRWIRFGYDTSDHLISIDDFTGRGWSFEYDVSKRLSKIVYPPISGSTDPSVRYEYAADIGGNPSDKIVAKRDANNAVIYSNTYDTAGRIVGQTWGGHTATLSYGTSGGLSETTYTQFDGTVNLYRYSSSGELVEEQLLTRGIRASEPTSYTKTYTFGAGGLHRMVTFPSGIVEEHEYDSRGNETTFRVRPSALSTASIETHATYSTTFNQVLTKTDALGNVTTYTYDAHGNLTRVDYPTVTVPQTQSAHLEFTYNAAGQMLQALDEEGRKTSYVYAGTGPAAGFLLETRHEISSGNVEVYGVAVDALGRITSESAPWGSTGSRTYNAWDLVATSTTPSGATTTYSYDGNGRPTSVVRPNRKVDGSAAPGASSYTTLFEHDVRGFVTKVRSEVTSGTFAESTFTYSPLGYVQTATDPNGKVTRTDYDERGFLWKVRHAYGTSDEISETQDYDLDGRPIRQTDPRGYASTSAFDEYGRLIRVESALRGYLATTLNARGDITSSTLWDSMGTSTTGDDQIVTKVNYLIDERGRTYGSDVLVSGTTYAQSRLSFDRSALITQSVAPGGQATTFEYDGGGRLTSTRDALGNKSSRVISGGRVVAETAYDRINNADVLTAQTNISYDIDGNVSTVSHLPIGGAQNQSNLTTTAIFDVDGRVLTSIDPRGNETRLAYDGLGRVTSRTRPHGGTNLVDSFAYDAGGRMVSRTDSAGETVSFAYDHLNRRTSATYPGSKVETFVHDAGGNLTRWTDRNGTVVQQAFDALGRMTGRTMTLASGVVGATSESFAYDAADRLISASNNAGSGHADTLSYSSLGRLLTESQDGRTVSYGYDIDGARVSRTAPSGRGINYVRDALKRVTSVTGAAPTTGTLFTSTWTGASRRTAGSFGNGVSWTRNYDSYLRPSLEQHTNSGGVFFGRGYGYDAANNVTSVAYQPESVYDLHTVDDLDRVTSSTIAANALTNPTSALGTLGSTLDGRGNRSQTSWTAWGSGTPATTSYTGGLESSYSAVGGVSFTYDQNGNLKSDGVKTYAYDWANHLIEVRDASTTALLVSFEYDAVGRRVRKQVFGTNAKTSTFVYDGVQLMEEYDGSGTRVAHFIHGDGIDRAAVIETATSTFYCHLDRLGSVSAITDGSGAVVERYFYGPNGETQIYNGQGQPVTSSTVGNPFGYTGHVYDSEIGLYHYRARAYSPAIGRFLQLDPAGFVDGMNRYQYAGGNPLRFLDPSGCGFWDAVGSMIISGITAACQQGAVEILVTLATAAVVVATGGAALPVLAGGMQLLGGQMILAGVAAAAGEGTKHAMLAAGADPEDAELASEVIELGINVTGQTVRMRNLNRAREAEEAAKRWKKPKSNRPARDARPGSTPGAGGGSPERPKPPLERGTTPSLRRPADGSIVDKTKPGETFDSTPRGPPAEAGSGSATGGTTGPMGAGPRCAAVKRCAQEACRIPGVPARSANTPYPIDPSEALEDGMTFLGPGYKDCGGGRFVSADGVRQFRMTDNDILGVDSPCGPHVHFEELNPGRANSNFHRQIK